MRTFAEKPKATQQTTSAKATVPGPSHFGRSHEVSSILHLQRTIGNQAVQRLLQSNAEERNAVLTGTALPHFGHDFSRIPIHPPTGGEIKTKLAINKPGDEYEQEADRVAEQVMRMPEPRLQRACACDGTCPKWQTERSSHIHERVQATRDGSGDLVQSALPATVNEVLAAPGQPLDSGTRGFMESRFGTSEGRKLLAHELTHVAQHCVGPGETLQRMPASAETTDTPGGWHTVREGESLSLIAADVYGDMMKWPVIYEANIDLIKDPDLIEIGWKLFIPPSDTEAGLARGAIEGMEKAKEQGFSDTCKLNRKDWEPIDDGNFRLKPGRSASKAVLGIFSGTTSIDCAGAVWASLAYAVLQTIGPTRFDNVMGKEGQDNQNLVIGQQVLKAEEGMLQYLIKKPEPKSIADLLPGDAVYFKNTEDIQIKHPGSPWQGENTIYLGDGEFNGHGIDPGTEDEILKRLADEYNKPPTKKEKKHPDYNWRWRWHKVDPSELPGIQWDTVIRLDAEAVDLL